MASWFTSPSDPRQRVVTVVIPDLAADTVVVPPPCSGTFLGAYASSGGNPGGGGATIAISLSGSIISTIAIGAAQGQTVRRSTTPTANKVTEYTGAPLVISATGGGTAGATVVELFFLAAQ